MSEASDWLVNQYGVSVLVTQELFCALTDRFPEDKFERRYEQTGRLQDTELTIQKAEEALRLMPTDQPQLAGYLNDLGNTLESRYQRTDSMDDLELAIRLAKKGVQLVPESYPELPSFLDNLTEAWGLQ